MDPKPRQPHGLRPTLRHLMILVVYFALATPLLRPESLGPNSINVTLLLPVSPLLLALLVLVFDRPGPMKFWLAGLLASLTVPLILTPQSASGFSVSPASGKVETR